MTATLFTLKSGSGAIVGAALICPEARYVSIRWRGAERLDRCFGTVVEWRALEDELRTVPLCALPPNSVTRKVTGVGTALEVQYLYREDIEVRSPADTASALDARLRSEPVLASRVGGLTQ